MLLCIVGDGTLEAQANQDSNGLHWGLLDFLLLNSGTLKKLE